jgi:hypothetical protein
LSLRGESTVPTLRRQCDCNTNDTGVRLSAAVSPLPAMKIKLREKKRCVLELHSCPRRNR